MTTATLYDQDFYAWTQNQADLLRHAQYSRLDWVETNLPKNRFPLTCPYTTQQILDDEFFPSA